jgi:hypothetical protein
MADTDNSSGKRKPLLCRHPRTTLLPIAIKDVHTTAFIPGYWPRNIMAEGLAY